ncbi:MAG: hypothetical protein GY829_10660 [Gammaproteobacteria bacterium]|nr:hypothetical protein [Gammaproteobacteria bacterium]
MLVSEIVVLIYVGMVIVEENMSADNNIINKVTINERAKRSRTYIAWVMVRALIALGFCILLDVNWFVQCVGLTAVVVDLCLLSKQRVLFL